MSEYVVTHESECAEIGKRDGMILAACHCGSGHQLPDKGLGRATIAAWWTRHQNCEWARWVE